MTEYTIWENWPPTALVQCVCKFFSFSFAFGLFLRRIAIEWLEMMGWMDEEWMNGMNGDGLAVVLLQLDVQNQQQNITI